MRGGLASGRHQQKHPGNLGCDLTQTLEQRRHLQPVSDDGIVKLTGSADIVITRDPLVAQTVVVSLNPATASSYAEKCAQPATRAGGRGSAIRRINGVGPNADGVITLRFK